MHSNSRIGVCGRTPTDHFDSYFIKVHKVDGVIVVISLMICGVLTIVVEFSYLYN